MKTIVSSKVQIFIAHDKQKKFTKLIKLMDIFHMGNIYKLCLISVCMW